MPPIFDEGRHEQMAQFSHDVHSTGCARDKKHSTGCAPARPKKRNRVASLGAMVAGGKITKQKSKTSQEDSKNTASMEAHKLKKNQMLVKSVTFFQINSTTKQYAKSL